MQVTAPSIAKPARVPALAGSVTCLARAYAPLDSATVNAWTSPALS